jgi:hypothetical protein
MRDGHWLLYYEYTGSEVPEGGVYTDLHYRLFNR